ncbi:MAG TPA: IS1182 family transposase [Dokdonella sp.]
MAKPRVTHPVRNQGEIRFELPEDALSPEHPARVLWSVLSRMDLSAFLDDARAVEGGSGRPTSSPRMLLTLWTYAISRGVGSAREIERLTRTDVAYQWIVGDQRPGRSTIAAFRVEHLAALDRLLTDVLAALMQQGVLSLETVAIDGMRVRANASAPSFRRDASLEELREQAALHLKAVLAEADDPALSARQRAARIAKARDFQQRVDCALKVVGELNAARKPGSKPARASSTDPQARVMKMGDGGFRPGMNVQMATAGDAIGGPRTIVAVGVSNVGSDMGTLAPLVEQIERRTGELPENVLADANHANHDAITALTQQGVDVLIPVPERTRKSGGAPEIEAWRARMQTPEAKQIYRARASLCELTNANARRMGMTQLLVRGIEKATGVVLLTAIAHDVLTHATALLS